jgi:hypothetical protein
MHMDEISEPKPERVLQIGPDRVAFEGENVVIEARHEMPDWEVRELNPAPVYFEDKKYFLIEKRRANPPFAVRYLLSPWPIDQTAGTKLFYTYDAEIVAEREANHRLGNRDEIVRLGLLPFYPFLGLLWSGTQQRLTRFGFIPRAITSASIFVVFILLFAEGVFACVMINTSMRSGKLMVGGIVRAMLPDDHIHLGPIAIPVMLIDTLLLLSFVADVLARYSRFLHEDQWSGGFLEWLFRRKANRGL